MTWTAPVAPRADPPWTAAERIALQGWLDYHRATLLTKCTGLDGEQLATRAVEPSSLSLLGLVRHMTDVERWWFRRIAGDADLAPVFWSDEVEGVEFDEADGANAAADLAAYVAECESADEAVRELSLDAEVRHDRLRNAIDLRWIYLHMIEEYARHNGHADLLRERIDGVTGE
jgi:uncharacterized damage-inducible protein DinB